MSIALYETNEGVPPISVLLDIAESVPCGTWLLVGDVCGVMQSRVTRPARAFLSARFLTPAIIM